MDIQGYWQAVLRKDAQAIRSYFGPQAQIFWHNTNECFTVEAFIEANCQYPGKWTGCIERLEEREDLAITVARVWALSGTPSLHAASFLTLRSDRILRLDEYWGDDGPAPKWRRDMALGRPIVPE